MPSVFASSKANQESYADTRQELNIEQTWTSRRSLRKKNKRRKKKTLDPKLVAARKKVEQARLYSGDIRPKNSTYHLPDFPTLPLIKRFKDGDRSLSTRCIRNVYYNYTPIKLPKKLRNTEINSLNDAIKSRNFVKALKLCKRQLKFAPLNLTLLSKTCELAHHLKDKSYQLYTWQLTELLYTISTSGDGLTDETPYELRSILDIIRFEELWLQTDKDAILEIKIHPQEKGNLVKLFFNDKEGKEQIRYYQLVNSI